MKKIRRYLNGLSHAVYPEMCYSHLPANLRKQMVSIASIESRKKQQIPTLLESLMKRLRVEKFFQENPLKPLFQA